MSRTWWIYPTRRFAVDCLRCQVRSRAKGDGLHSSLEVGGEIVAFDHTPNFGAEAVRNHNLEWVLPDGRVLDVDLGWMGVWTTGIVVRINGQTVYESHPGRAPAYPESLRENVVTYTSAGDVWAKALHGDRGDGAGPLAAGIFARHNRLPLAVDVVTGLLFYMIAKLVDLQTAALFGIVIGVGLIVFQRITGIDVTGGMVLFGIVMLAISAGLAFAFQDEEWIKLRGTITGLIAASFFLIDGWRGGPYIGRGMARYMPYTDINAGRLAIGLGLVGLTMAALNYAVAKHASTDAWLFYKTFVDFIIAGVLAMAMIRWARLKRSSEA